MRDRVEDLLQQPQAPILGRRPPDARQAVARSHIGTSTRGHGPRVHHDQIVPAHIRHQQSAAPTPTRRTVRPQRSRAPSHPPRGRERKQRDEMADISLACWSRPTDSGRPVRAAHCYPAANTRPRFWRGPVQQNPRRSQLNGSHVVGTSSFCLARATGATASSGRRKRAPPSGERRARGRRGMKLIRGGLLSGSGRTVGSPGTGAFWENVVGQAVLDDALRARGCLYWPPLRLARVVLRARIGRCRLPAGSLPLIDARRLS
jgi:hypothetical protein